MANETMEKYGEIQRMWAQAYAVMTAPQGFRKACEEYVRDALRNVLKTEVLLAKHKTNFGEMTAVCVNEGSGRVEVRVAGYDEPRTLYEMDEDGDVHEIVRYVFNYLQGEDFSGIEANVGKDGAISPYRVVDGLVVKPLASLEGEFRLEDGVLYVSQNDFYKDMDDYIVEGMSYNVENIKRLYERVDDGEDEGLFRRVAGEYLKREMWQTALRGYIEFPCDERTFEVHNVPERLDGEWTFEDAQLDKIYVGSGVGYEGKVVFDFSNGRIEDIDEIDCGYLWYIVSSIEYKKFPHYAKLAEMAKDISVTTHNDYAEMAQEFVRHIIFNKMHSSRWSVWHDDLYLTIINKNNEPVGLLADIVCKGDSIKVELRHAMTLPYPTSTDKTERIDFMDLSPISMAHLVAYVGADEEKTDFRHLRHLEEDGVRVPYKTQNGEKISHLDVREDREMMAIAKKHGVKLGDDPVTFYYYDYERLAETIGKHGWE